MGADKDSGMNFSYEEYETLLEKGKFEEATAYKARFLPDVLYKFVPLYDDTNLDKRIMEDNNKRFSSLERGEIWFSSREAMNDPFEFTGIYIDEAKMRNIGWDADRLAKIKQDFLDSFFLASFTSNMSNNLPMWAHYANNHAGYCVKYNVGKIANVHRVLYLSKRYHQVFAAGGDHIVEPKEIWKLYTSDLYRMDAYYRHFHFAFGNSLKNSNDILEDGLKHSTEFVEALYQNWFLRELTACWANAAADDLASLGYVSEIEKQRDFYKRCAFRCRCM